MNFQLVQILLILGSSEQIICNDIQRVSLHQHHLLNAVEISALHLAYLLIEASNNRLQV